MKFLDFKPKKTVAAVGVIACIATLGGAISVGATDDKKPAVGADKPALTVTTTKPQQALMAASFGASGNIVAWQEAIVGAEINGLRITEVKVNIGDRVKRGQVLASLATEMVDAELAQSVASVAEAEAAHAEAQANADRARSLDTSGALSAQQIQQLVTAAKTAEARLAAARAVAKVQRVRLAQTNILAPDDGTISARQATVGAVVQAGQEMFRMVRQNRLEWRAEVTASELARVRVGQKAIITTPGGDQVEGKVRMIGPTVDPATRNVQVYVDLLPSAAANTTKSSGTSGAKAGMFARGLFLQGEASALTLPEQAVVVREGFSYAFVVDAKNRVKQVKIEVGTRDKGRVEIKGGLDANAVVVASGSGFLKDGDLVRVVAPTTAAAKMSPTKK